MTGQGLLDTLCGSSSILGKSDKNINDSVWRATVLDWINIVVQDIQNRQENFHWRWLEKTATTTTVANQHSYDLPSDIDTNKILNVYERTNDITLTFIDYNKFVELVADPSQDTGTSTLWTLFANTLRLYPVPDSAITIFMDYVRVIGEVSDNATALVIPDKYKKVVLDGTLAHIYEFDPELGQAQLKLVEHEAGITRMKQDNIQVPGENMRPFSHRQKYLLENMNRGDGIKGIFPLDV